MNPVSVTTYPYIPKPEVVAIQGVREAIVAQGELLEEQVKETVRLEGFVPGEDSPVPMHHQDRDP